VGKEDEKEEEPEPEGRRDEFDLTTTQRPTEPQSIDDKCILPYYPATDPDLGKAWRFGILHIFK